MSKKSKLTCSRCKQPLVIHPASRLGDPIYIHRSRAARRNRAGQQIDPLNRCMYIFAAMTPARRAELEQHGYINSPLEELQELNPAASKPTVRDLARQQLPEHSPWEDDAEYWGYH